LTQILPPSACNDAYKRMLNIDKRLAQTGRLRRCSLLPSHAARARIREASGARKMQTGSFHPLE